MALPFLVQAGISGGAGALSGYFSGAAEDRRRKQLMRKLMELLSTESLGRETTAQYNMMRSGPMALGARRMAMQNSSALGNRIQTNFARSGLGRSGVAAMSIPMARSSFAPALMDIDASLYSQALSGARNTIGQRIDALRGGYGPSGGQSAWAGGLESLMPLLMEYFKKNGG